MMEEPEEQQGNRPCDAPYMYFIIDCHQVLGGGWSQAFPRTKYNHKAPLPLSLAIERLPSFVRQ